MAHLLVLHGPNLNLLGKREPNLYGHETLDSINQQLGIIAEQANHQISFYQTNNEATLLDHIHSAPQQDVNFIIINAAALTHTSIALRDALLAVAIPFIEVHLTNLAQREAFRQHSYLTDIALGSIQGFGIFSYQLALHAALHYLEVR
ncbi:MAG: type II 3-dehydroquinate dehydratase [Gammaproteobacteria bacterium]